MARSVSLFWGGLLVFGGVACGPSEGDTPPPADAGSAANAGNAGVSGALGAGAGAGGSSGVAGRAGGVGAGGGGGSGVSGAGGAGAGGAGSGGEGGGGTAGVSSGSGGGGLGGVGGDGEAGSLGGSAGTTGGAAGAGASGMAGSGGGVSGSAGSGGAPPTEPLTIYLAGDSTVSTYNDTASPTDQAGWGQVLDAEFGELVTVENRAIGGRTARRFIDEGALARIFEDIAPGDYLFVQFGTNDGNKTATYEFEGQTIPYYLDPATDFKTYLMKYIEGARERSATPVLVTPPPRNSAYCTGGNGTGAHAAAMRELGAAEGVAVADLNQKTVDHLKAICPAPTPEDFFFVRTDGSVDGTHFQENGARIMAGFVGDGVREAGLPLAALLL